MKDSTMAEKERRMRYLLALSVCIILLWLPALYAIRPHVWQIVDAMVEENEFHDAGVGRGYLLTHQRRLYDSLSRIATDEELVDLSDYTSPVVRCYAFLALVERRYASADSLVQEHESDMDTVEVHSGCLVHSMTVGEFFSVVGEGRFVEKQSHHRRRRKR